MSVTAERLLDVEYGDELRVYVGEQSYRGFVDLQQEYDDHVRVDVRGMDWGEWFDEARLFAERDEDGEWGDVEMAVADISSAEEWDEWEEWEADRRFSVDGVEVVNRG